MVEIGKEIFLGSSPLLQSMQEASGKNRERSHPEIK